MCACVFLCVHVGMLKDFLLCVSSMFLDKLGKKARGKLVFLEKEG